MSEEPRSNQRVNIASEAVQVSSFVSADGVPGVEVFVPGMAQMRMTPGAAILWATKLFVGSVCATNGIEHIIQTDPEDAATFCKLCAECLPQVVPPAAEGTA